VRNRYAISLVCLAALVSAPARAEELRVHGIGGGTLPIGAPQSQEYGLGGGGALAVEVPLVPPFGLQVEGGALAQSKAGRPADPTLADHGGGNAIFGAFGARIHPFAKAGTVAGPWLDANIGFAETGGAGRPTFDAHIGHDFRVGSGRIDVGPFVGYTHIFQPDDTLRPEDAHIFWAGIHFGLGARRAETARPPEMARVVPPPPPPPPPPVVEAAKSDRDGDAIVDEEDACPDVPGPRTDDPKTNGCPPADDHVRVEGDKIVLDDIIHFDTDSPRVKRVSWPILRHVADFINATTDLLEVDIEGHADKVGTETYNQRLSEERAASVKRLLVHFGVDTSKLTTRGHGEMQPRAFGDTERQFKENRRVEFTITRARHGQPQATKGEDL
jgi:outer membrane protein OmpA-like peptidoglycan-associated protein